MHSSNKNKLIAYVKRDNILYGIPLKYMDYQQTIQNIITHGDKTIIEKPNNYNIVKYQSEFGTVETTKAVVIKYTKKRNKLKKAV